MASYVKLKCLTENFQCGICQGYIIDATTITECLHSFCKSCIFHFIECTDHRCPTCNQSLTDIENCISSDASLQRLIYRLVPNLLENEINRREQFRLQNLASSELMINQSTLLNLKLYTVQKVDKHSGSADKTSNSNKSTLNSNLIGGDYTVYDDENSENIDTENKYEITNVKYLQCSAQTPIEIISKMLRNKYNIPPNYGIRFSHMGHKIGDKESLLQIFTSLLKTKDELLELKYQFFKKKNKKKSLNRVLNDSNPADVSCLQIDVSRAKTEVKNSPTTCRKNVSIKQQKKTKSTVKETTKANNKNSNYNNVTDSTPKISSNKGKNATISPSQKKNESSREIKTSEKLKEPENNNINEDDSVYYSDQNYDDDSQEGKLLIDDDQTSQNDNDKHNKRVSKKNLLVPQPHDSPLDLRVARK